MSLSVYPSFEAERRGFIIVVPLFSSVSTSTSQRSQHKRLCVSNVAHKVPVNALTSVGSTSILMLDHEQCGLFQSEIEINDNDDEATIFPKNISLADNDDESTSMVLCLIGGLCGWVNASDIRPRSLPAFYKTTLPIEVHIDGSAASSIAPGSPTTKLENLKIPMTLPPNTLILLDEYPDATDRKFHVTLANGNILSCPGYGLQGCCIPITGTAFTSCAPQKGTLVSIHGYSEPKSRLKHWTLHRYDVAVGVKVDDHLVWTICRPEPLSSGGNTQTLTYLLEMSVKEESPRRSQYSQLPLLEVAQVELRMLSPELLSRSEACLRLRSTPILPFTRAVDSDLEQSNESKDQTQDDKSIPEGNLCGLWDSNLGPLLTTDCQYQFQTNDTGVSNHRRTTWLQIVTEGIRGTYFQQQYTQKLNISDLCQHQSRSETITSEQDEVDHQISVCDDKSGIQAGGDLELDISKSGLRDAMHNHTLFMCLYLLVPPCLLLVILMIVTKFRQQSQDEMTIAR
jgi:hypothetical protein